MWASRLDRGIAKAATGSIGIAAHPERIINQKFWGPRTWLNLLVVILCIFSINLCPTFLAFHLSLLRRPLTARIATTITHLICRRRARRPAAGPPRRACKRQCVDNQISATAPTICSMYRKVIDRLATAGGVAEGGRLIAARTLERGQPAKCGRLWG